jgi:RNA polymerase sigma-70 factor (ECF subfamily)
MSTLTYTPPPPAVPSTEAAFVDFLAEYDRHLRAVAFRLLGDVEVVDDVLQEAYLKAFAALPRFRGESSLGTWLHRIVHNTCMDELRRRRRLAERPYDDCAPAGDGDSGDITAERADLAAGLAELSEELRAAVVLVDGYGMPYAAAARVLGIPAGTVGSRAFRARAALRRSLAVDAR